MTRGILFDTAFDTTTRPPTFHLRGAIRSFFTEKQMRDTFPDGHELDWRVTLGLESQDGQIEQLQILMTEHNRALVRD